MVEDIVDPRRREPPFVLAEREMLEAWLDFHRMTLLLKCEGLDDTKRKAQPVVTSKLSLHGLVRHMAEVERNWFQRVLANAADTAPIWYDPKIDDSELVPLDEADWESDLDAWQAECDASRTTAAGRSLDDTGTFSRGRRRPVGSDRCISAGEGGLDGCLASATPVVHARRSGSRRDRESRWLDRDLARLGSSGPRLSGVSSASAKIWVHS